MFLHMTGVIMLSFLEYGFYSSNLTLGSSVARAKAANVSIKRLIQSIYTVFRGGEWEGKTIDPTIIITIATMLMTSWN